MKKRDKLITILLLTALLDGGSGVVMAQGVRVNGSVFGGGNEADVRGNATVRMDDGFVYDRIYGGGKLGNVGTFKVTKHSGTDAHEGCIGKPNEFTDNTGICTVNVNGGRVGPLGMMMPTDYGHVFGAGRGELNNPDVDKDVDYRTYVSETHVTISGTAFIMGSVYGGSENGRVQHDTHVTIAGGQIGCGKDKSEPYDESQFVDPLTTTVTGNNALSECSSWEYVSPWLPYDAHANDEGYNAETYGNADTNGSDGHTFYGNVFGGGSGYWSYQKADGSYEWLPSAGLVEGNTHVTITGGHILTSVYGGNEMTNVTGTCHITMEGGTVGVPRTLEQIANHPVTCNIFGAGKGDQRVHFNKSTNVANTVVQIKGGIVYGSVFGGGEDGHVLRNVTMTVSDGTIGTWGTSYMEGNVFGGGRGFGGDAYTAGNIAGSVTMNITGGNMLGSVYGGGRLGSLGYGLYDATETGKYGTMRPDGYADDGTTPIDGFKRGYVTMNISGGVIGNDREFKFFGSSVDTEEELTNMKNANYIPNTEFEYNKAKGYYMLTHTKGGNVFAGGMGRRTQLDGVTPIPSSVIDWQKLGKVKSTTLTISGTAQIKGNVYGGGELGAVAAYKGETDEGGTTSITITGGTIGAEVKDGETVKYTFGSVYGGGMGIIYEEGEGQSKTNVQAGGGVDGNVGVTMSGDDTKVLASVFGGGELATVDGSTTVTISGGKIGRNEVDKDNGYVMFGSSTMGNVFGSGKGSTKVVTAGLVKKNTNVNISGKTEIYHNVYGGGALASVGTFKLANNDSSSDDYCGKFNVPGMFNYPVGTPVNWEDGTGTATVTITGTPIIGISGRDNGMVSGSSRGDVDKPDANGVDVNDKLGWVKNTVVTVGTKNDGNEGPHIKGSLYGGGENGHNFGNTTVTINSGTIGIVDPNDPWYSFSTAELNKKARQLRGNVYGSGCGTDTYTDANNKEQHNPMAGFVRGNTTITINGGDVAHDVFGGGSMGSVGGNVEVTVNGGLVREDVYGGCARAHTNAVVGTGNNATDKETTVNLHGGKISGTAYGGGLGQKYKAAVAAQDNVSAQAAEEAIPAYVYGDVLVELNKESGDNCQVLKIHGCNNYNGTPKGDVLVHVYKTVAFGDETHKKSEGKDNSTFDMDAVYGGGNEAAYDPENPDTRKATVIIDGCGETSIKTVYGGGNAAPAPETYIKVNSCYEIGTLFAGGNGKDAMDDGSDNPGADVGLIALKDGGTAYASDDTKQEYGTGKALAELLGGTIHAAFGGSNTKGNVRASGTVTLNEADPEECPLCVEEVYGAGNEAHQDGTSNINLGCISYLKEMYGGANNADVNNNVVLTIQSGRFDRVFGGNNIGGCIRGSITVNIEETGCHPIVIGQLYGGGNQAGYSVYGYKKVGDKWVTREDTDGLETRMTKKFDDPVVNVRSFTSIGEIFGGGYGRTAVMVGNPTVNIDVCVGDNNDKEMKQIPNEDTGVPEDTDESMHTGETIKINKGAMDEVSVEMPLHKKGQIGAIGNVFGGGNAAAVKGDTNVNIGTKTGETIEFESLKDAETKTRTVVGADIRGNVYGGGNNAEVTGNANVNIGKKTE